MVKKLRNLVIGVCVLFAFTAAAAETTPETIRLWKGNAPGAQGNAEEDIPTLTIFRPEGKATGASILIFPGGGYYHVSVECPEGSGYAHYLNQYGITAFVLKYRLGPKYHHPCQLQDASRAMRLIRYNAKKWNLDPNRIGVMGSSAGGHLACSMLTLFEPANQKKLDPIEKLSSRPDVGILCYAVVTMVGSEFVPGEFADLESKDALMGTDPTPDLVQYLSGEKMVSKDTPPCFIWHSLEDDDVALENPVDFAMALKKAKIPFELHIFETGKHGCGLDTKEVTVDGKTTTEVHAWAKDLIHWLKLRKFVE